MYAITGITEILRDISRIVDVLDFPLDLLRNDRLYQGE